MEGTVAGSWTAILAGRDRHPTDGLAGDATSRAVVRLHGVLDQRAGGTGIWILLFLAVALAMVASGFLLLAYGLPIT